MIDFLTELEEEILRLSKIINVPLSSLPDYGEQKREEHPYIEIEGKYSPTYRYLAKERGVEHLIHITVNKEDILYWVFDSITFAIATRINKDNKNDDIDSRRIWFKAQEKLLGKINQGWENRKKSEHAKILEDCPFDDYVNKRVDMIVDLVKKGMSSFEASEQAYKAFSKPKQKHS